MFNIFSDIYNKTNKLDIAYNAIFVLCGARPAFLVQSIDYGENKFGPTTLGKITMNILLCLEKYLKITTTYQGFIISKYDKTIPNELNDKIVGKIIGYPCSGDLNIENRRNYLCQYYVKKNKQKIKIMSIICNNKTNLKFKMIKKKMQLVLKKNNITGRVKCKFEKLLKIKNIMLKIKNNTKLNKKEKMTVENYIANIS